MSGVPAYTRASKNLSPVVGVPADPRASRGPFIESSGLAGTPTTRKKEAFLLWRLRGYSRPSEIPYICINKEKVMELLIRNIKAKKDIKFIQELAERLGLQTTQLSIEEKEEIGLGLAIEAGRKSGYVSEKIVLKTLRNIRNKK
jgi:hypothetical protein